MAYSSLAVHIKTNMSFKIVPNMSWSIDEIENMSPFEKEAYMLMINEYLTKLKEKRGK